MTGGAPGIWIAVAESGEVGRALLACEADERKLVLYRLEDGRPVALDDECWHRLLPLSNGRLDGNNVVCAYHGLTFGPDGQCVRARLGEPPAKAKVHSHSAVDRAGLVWVWTGGGGDAVSGEAEGGSLRIGSRRRFLPPKCTDQEEKPMPDKTDGSMEMQAEIKALFDAYRDTFVERAAAAAAFYSEPCVTARSGVVRVHPSHADLAAFFSEVDTQYRKRGYTHFDDVSFDWRSLGANSALVTMRWAYKDAEKRTIWETTFSYNLYKRGGTWKILMQTLHDR